jgi:TatD DNase family protein
MLINIHTHFKGNTGIEIINSETTLLNTTYSYGLAPWSLENISESDFENLDKKMEYIKIITHKNCISIGEIGLDKNLSIDLNNQIQLFINQIIISEEYKLPILLHCVKSWNEILKIREEIKPIQPWIFHGFRKTNLLDSILKSGVHISIGAAIMKDLKLQECIKKIPNDRLFLETDNSKDYTIYDIYEKAASIKNISLQTLENQLFINTKNTFTKWEIG